MVGEWRELYPSFFGDFLEFFNFAKPLTGLVENILFVKLKIWDFWHILH